MVRGREVYIFERQVICACGLSVPRHPPFPFSPDSRHQTTRCAFRLYLSFHSFITPLTPTTSHSRHSRFRSVSVPLRDVKSLLSTRCSTAINSVKARSIPNYTRSPSTLVPSLITPLSISLGTDLPGGHTFSMGFANIQAAVGYALIAMLVIPKQVEAGASAWHFDVQSTLLLARLDPIISENKVASHVHRIWGGNNFAAAYSYEESQKGNCSSIYVQEDKSNYW